MFQNHIWLTILFTEMEERQIKSIKQIENHTYATHTITFILFSNSLSNKCTYQSLIVLK